MFPNRHIPEITLKCSVKIRKQDAPGNVLLVCNYMKHKLFKKMKVVCCRRSDLCYAVRRRDPKSDPKRPAAERNGQRLKQETAAIPPDFHKLWKSCGNRVA